MSLAERLEAKIERIPESGCWLFIGTLRDGYGRIRQGGRRDSPLLQAHRASYELAKGKIPEGLQLDHLCRVRCCVNPAHLEPVTHLENAHRGAHATKTHCKHGHEFTPENIERWAGKPRTRYCKECRKYQSRKAKQYAS